MASLKQVLFIVLQDCSNQRGRAAQVKQNPLAHNMPKWQLHSHRSGGFGSYAQFVSAYHVARAQPTAHV